MAKINAPIIRSRFQNYISNKKWTAKEFHERWTKQYNLSIGYNNFVEMLNNNVSWKLAYAWALADMLETDMHELFDFSEIKKEIVEEV